MPTHIAGGPRRAPARLKGIGRGLTRRALGREEDAVADRDAARRVYPDVGQTFADYEEGQP